MHVFTWSERVLLRRFAGIQFIGLCLGSVTGSFGHSEKCSLTILVVATGHEYQPDVKVNNVTPLAQ